VARIGWRQYPKSKAGADRAHLYPRHWPDQAAEICTKVGIPDARRVHELTDDEVLRIRELIDREYTVEGDLRRQVA